MDAEKDLNILNPTIAEKNEKMMKYVREKYNKKRNGCEKNIYSYDYRSNIVKNVRCMHISCVKCRQSIKKTLFVNLMEVCEKKDINNHYIFTSSGKGYRENTLVKQSYYDMAYSWKKIHQVIDYWFYKKWDIDEKLSYIVLPRSQNDGFCHYHLLTNMNFEKDWLRSKIKDYKNMGYLEIGKREKPVHYLCTDFFKDVEYMIPEGIRHISVSRDIKLDYRIKFKKKDKIVFYKNRYRDEWENLEDFNKKVLDKYNVCLPFDVWLKYFQTKKF